MNSELQHYTIDFSDDLIKEQSYLVSRGVRPLALIGHCEANPTLLLQVATKIEMLAEPNVIPFVIDRNDGFADYGYAGASWVVDLVEWLIKNELPEIHRLRIIGLLCGYSTEALTSFEELKPKRLFCSPTL